MASEDTIQYRSPLPSGQFLEGVHIDDHLVLFRGPSKDLHLRHGPDFDIINAPHRAYQQAEVEVATSKAFGAARLDSLGDCPGESIFLAWGTEVNTKAGTVSAPIIKKALMCMVGASILALHQVPKGPQVCSP
eukprot:11721056-Karenia_brevis.AAC.1